MASSIASFSCPRRLSLRRSSSREWSRRLISLSPVSTALPGGLGVRGLELFCCTGRSPYGAGGLDGRGCSGRLLAHFGLDLSGQCRVLTQVVAHVLAALAQTLVTIGHPGPALLEDG